MLDRLARRYGSTPSAVVGLDGWEGLLIDLRCALLGEQREAHAIQRMRRDSKDSMIPLPFPVYSMGGR